MTQPRQFFAPQNPDYLDNINYTQRVVDAILRNNPLTNAVISHGLMRWLGNYLSGGGPDLINFLWIGEFLPADTNLPGNPPQRGFSLVRDDSRGGRTAINVYDPTPSGGGGLKQRIFFGGGDGQRLADEHRDGGWAWPEEQIAMGEYGSLGTAWVGVIDTSPTWGIIAWGTFSVVGNAVGYTFVGFGDGTGAEYRVRVAGSPDTVSATHSVGSGAFGQFSGTVDATGRRGVNTDVFLEGRRTSGAGTARATPISFRCYSP